MFWKLERSAKTFVESWPTRWYQHCQRSLGKPVEFRQPVNSPRILIIQGLREWEGSTDSGIALAGEESVVCAPHEVYVRIPTQPFVYRKEGLHCYGLYWMIIARSLNICLIAKRILINKARYNIPTLSLWSHSNTTVCEQGGWTVLMWAAKNGNRDIAALLLDRGAGVDRQDKV